MVKVIWPPRGGGCDSDVLQFAETVMRYSRFFTPERLPNQIFRSSTTVTPASLAS